MLVWDEQDKEELFWFFHNNFYLLEQLSSRETCQVYEALASMNYGSSQKKLPLFDKIAYRFIQLVEELQVNSLMELIKTLSKTNHDH